ncbi:ATP-dependent nuclease [Pseudomonas sp. A-R-19]|uniref:ATP-dependent nuclease n=1 Tax=Pseudomonas sp. A-R-19 TaxID=2832403 RepID=UPI001CBE27D9|nr:AAA family ATPase [Pseudomonas sp. A-R-19]
MPLERIEIHGYRGFKNIGSLDFAVPNGEFGSGLTIITGPNNSGKSSILECLKARSGYQPPSFTTGTRNIATDSVEIKFTINAKTETIKSITKGASETTKENPDQGLHIFILPSRRAFEPYFGKGGEWTREQLAQNTILGPQRSSTLTGFSNRLFNILKQPEEFNKILTEVLGFSPTWSIDQTDQGSYFLKFYNGENSHSSDGMGEGIVSVFAIADALYDSKPGNVIVIDEPELSLHPSLQKRMASLLFKYSKDRQIIISTHSPYFIDLKALACGGHLARVTTGDDGTKIHQITNISRTSIAKLSGGNIFNPHVFGLDSKELFFQDDQIILTEGQEDVLLLPEIAHQLEKRITGSFFGWGAGGAGNIKHLCHILKDLGYKKVAGVLDDDKQEDRDSLQKEFPEYFFACIPAKDIRTKPAREATEEVLGLLDSKRKIKPEYTNSTALLFDELNNHMTS